MPNHVNTVGFGERVMNGQYEMTEMTAHVLIWLLEIFPTHNLHQQPLESPRRYALVSISASAPGSTGSRHQTLQLPMVGTMLRR